MDGRLAFFVYLCDMKMFLTALLCCCSLANATARSWHAAPSGRANAVGNQTDPMDIYTAVHQLHGGDSLLLSPDTFYLSQGLVINVSSTNDCPTYIGTSQGEGHAVLDFRNQPHFKNGVTLKGDYIHLTRLNICYAGYKGLLNEGSHNRMEQLDIYGNCDSGIQQKGGYDNLIIDCDSHDNFDYMTGSLEAADWGGNADGFADKQYAGSPGNTYIRCRAWNNSDDGWDFYQRVGGTTRFIECECRDNGPREYDLTLHPRRHTDRAFLDQFAGKGIVIKLKPNKNQPEAQQKEVCCSLAHFYNNGNGNGFKLGGAGTKHDVELTHCVAQGNSTKGFDQNSNAGHMTLLDCQAEKNGQNYGFYNDNGYTLTIKNCTSTDGGKPDTFKGRKIEQVGNSWQNTPKS